MGLIGIKALALCNTLLKRYPVKRNTGYNLVQVVTIERDWLKGTRGLSVLCLTIACQSTVISKQNFNIKNT